MMLIPRKGPEFEKADEKVVVLLYSYYVSFYVLLVRLFDCFLIFFLDIEVLWFWTG